jgi:chromate transporter
VEQRTREERPENDPPGERSSLVELALLFLRLGATTFGGPAAHTAMMRHEVVERRKWLSDADFLDLIGATNFIPGPNSTELAIHIGHRRAGFRGLLVAGACFIVPAALVTFAFAWLYVRYGRLPQAGATLYGVKPVIVAVVVHALWGLGRTAMKTKVLALLGVASAVAVALGVHELLVLFGAASLYALSTPRRVAEPTSAQHDEKKASTALLLGAAPSAVAATAAVASPSALSVFLVFAKIGSVLFGSGYVLLAFLRSDLVVERHWLTEAQLLDAVAVGQLTPGPVFTTATFVGYLLGGTSGALAATAGIFLPAFFFVAISGPLVPRLRRSPRAGRFLDGLNVASLALMAVVTVSLARAAIVDAWTIALVLLGVALLLRTKINSAWLVLGGALAGNLVHALR